MHDLFLRPYIIFTIETRRLSETALVYLPMDVELFQNDDLLKCQMQFRNIEKKNLSEILKCPSSTPAARLDCYCIALSSPIRIGHIWDKAWESTGKQLATKNNQFHNWNTTLPVLFFPPFTGERGETLKKERDREQRTRCEHLGSVGD